MNIDLDIVRMQTKQPAWDFSIEIGGVRYVTRELSQEDFQRVTTSPAAIESAEGAELIAGLFTGDPPPPVETWDDTMRRSILASLVSYYHANRGEYQRAFTENIAKLIRAGGHARG